ncbi:X-ray repair cross-complementing protein 6-like [Rhopalosiphum maidis]|uniref:X-ray repair cross-complementing protein 6-like n=1 Tax=Rhopalosiphum maidis TaxID=43146 RepID=UPI000EFFF064|nr:X-ray repair cross-complementing protein 6-like [Rhopalosiphum maidis]XP_026812280.1 X-ray repair cross-complementing protein 6-like [Rhopalosiphum maidis]XP_026812281.1 X-ray repair cross-complementing protein 6-like [Rhopalosiphum maidis]XP_026812282.1 X-ray repair cross-complementing protein 6-like [Rhopalosiphum maidis]XP_026812283.1 X-ray repair cross-complementing protein 6-like [Rhopalosiphum maidis]
MEDLSDSPIVWESESFEEEKQKWFVKQHIMFLIDASKPMFNTYDNTTFFATSITLCKKVVLKLIRESRNDKIGILIYGTDDDNRKCPKYINALSEPIKPNIQLIKKLDDILTSKPIQTGQSPLSPLSDAIWYGNYLIKKFSENQSYSTIMLITCNDRPEIGDSKKQFHLRTRIDDVIKNNIDFKLIPIGTAFNMNLFYEGLLKNFNSISKPMKGLKSIDDIMLEINEKLKHGRSVSKIKFYINNDYYISTSLFRFYSKSKIPSKVRLDKRTNKPLTSNTQVFTIENDELIHKSDQAKYLVLADKRIIFKNEDLAILKSGILEPGIRLLGFTNKENIMISYHFKTPIFLRPNSDVDIGGTRMFNSLIECCLEKNKYIMCFLKIRKGGKVHLSTLIPQDEVIDETGTQKQPSGFHVIFLPFNECLKPVKPIEQTEDDEFLTSTQELLGMKICESMPINYYPSLIKNPKINFHWAMLESLALESEMPDILDETLPANDVFDKNLSTIKNDIYEHLLPHVSSLPKTNKKSDMNSQNFNGKGKKRKILQ